MIITKIITTVRISVDICWKVIIKNYVLYKVNSRVKATFSPSRRDLGFLVYQTSLYVLIRKKVLRFYETLFCTSYSITAVACKLIC